MSNVIVTPNMNLPNPVPSVDPGPDYANNLSNSLNVVDQHTHVPGQGVQIPPSGLNINSDLTFQNNNATALKSARFQVQPSALAGALDLGCLYVVGVDLWYNDESANQVRITSGGSVNAGAGNISGLPSGTASVAYSGGTYVFQSATATSAPLDLGSIILRNATASSKGLTLSPPNAMAADYGITLPSLPVSATNIVQIDTAGNMSAALVPDGSTITINSGVLGVPAGGITSTQISGGGLVPPGVISSYGGTTAPSGYLLCDGSSYLRATYPALFAVIGSAFGAPDGTHFNVPLLNGYFLRGWDNGYGNDPDAATRTALFFGGNTGDHIGSFELDAYKSHTHPNTVIGSLANTTVNNLTAGTNTTTGTLSTGASGGSETRPRNIYVNYIIKT